MAEAQGPRWKGRRWIVDGHNAIFALPTVGWLQREQKQSEARERLERLLMGFATRLERPLLIVYDGNEIAANPDALDRGPLRTLYSQPPEDADDRIVYLAERALRQGESVAVVTDDRSTLVPRLSAHVQVWPVLLFWKRFLSPPAPEAGRDGVAEKQLSAQDQEQIAALFLERSAEIEQAARRGARSREREAASRWAARTGAERVERATDENGRGWDPKRVFESPRVAGTPASQGGRTKQTGNQREPGRQAAASPGAAPPTIPDAAPSDSVAREKAARKQRGVRKQARRLQQQARPAASRHSPKRRALKQKRSSRRR